MATHHPESSSTRASQRELKRQYRESQRPQNNTRMGVYAIRNTETGRLYLSASLNFDAAMNRDRFQLKMNGHPSPELQAAWNRTGEVGFRFEVLDRVKPREDAPDFDYHAELEGLLSLWREDLAQTGVSFYPPAPHMKVGPHVRHHLR